MNAWSPTTTGRSASPAEVALSTAFSHTMAVAPTSTLEASESRTAPYMTLALGPTETRPTRTAVGATNAEACTTGSAARFLISTFLPPLVGLLTVAHRV